MTETRITELSDAVGSALRQVDPKYIKVYPMREYDKDTRGTHRIDTWRSMLTELKIKTLPEAVAMGFIILGYPESTSGQVRFLPAPQLVHEVAKRAAAGLAGPLDLAARRANEFVVAVLLGWKPKKKFPELARRVVPKPWRERAQAVIDDLAHDYSSEIRAHLSACVIGASELEAEIARRKLDIVVNAVRRFLHGCFCWKLLADKRQEPDSLPGNLKSAFDSCTMHHPIIEWNPCEPMGNAPSAAAQGRLLDDGESPETLNLYTLWRYLERAFKGFLGRRFLREQFLGGILGRIYRARFGVDRATIARFLCDLCLKANAPKWKSVHCSLKYRLRRKIAVLHKEEDGREVLEDPGCGLVPSPAKTPRLLTEGNLVWRKNIDLFEKRWFLQCMNPHCPARKIQPPPKRPSNWFESIDQNDDNGRRPRPSEEDRCPLCGDRYFDHVEKHKRRFKRCAPALVLRSTPRRPLPRDKPDPSETENEEQAELCPDSPNRDDSTAADTAAPTAQADPEGPWPDEVLFQEMLKHVSGWRSVLLSGGVESLDDEGRFLEAYRKAEGQSDFPGTEAAEADVRRLFFAWREIRQLAAQIAEQCATPEPSNKQALGTTWVQFVQPMIAAQAKRVQAASH